MKNNSRGKFQPVIMKLGYITRELVITDDKNYIRTGIEKKLLTQIYSLQKLGVEVEVIGRNNTVVSIKQRLTSLKEECHVFREMISRYTEEDCIYIRGVSDYFLDWYLLSLPRRAKVVFEINGLTRPDHKERIKPAKGLIRKLFYVSQYISCILLEKNVLKKSDGVVSVTNEITEYNKTLTDNTISYLTLGNGISTETIPVKKVPDYNNELHILVVAYINFWHGIDRFIRGLHEYNAHYANSTKIVLHIVGDGPELPHLKDLTNNLSLNEYVIFHGIKSGKELDEMFDMCHIAIGSLAGFRVGLNELSSLKSREYCARGIPFLMASKDADFPEGFNWVQMVPAEEQPIDMNTVIEFANCVMDDTEHPHMMRKYAEEHLDWMAKMRALKEFLESL